MSCSNCLARSLCPSRSNCFSRSLMARAPSPSRRISAGARPVKTYPIMDRTRARRTKAVRTRVVDVCLGQPHGLADAPSSVPTTRRRTPRRTFRQESAMIRNAGGHPRESWYPEGRSFDTAIVRGSSRKEASMRLDGKVALITGGANGMGRSEAAIFAKEGARVVVADILEADGQKVVADIKASGGQARFVKLDVTSEADWRDAVATTESSFGKLNILVNNAGISGSYDPDTMSTSAWDTIMNVNAKGVFLGMKYGIPAMQRA